MKSITPLLFTLFIGFSLSAQNGNVGIGIETPESKLHINGDLQVEDKVTINDSSSNARFDFDPNIGIFQMLDGSGNAFFSFEFDDGTNNIKGNQTSSNRSGKNTFAWKYDDQTESIVQIFDSNGNGELRESIIEQSASIVSSAEFRDANDILRKSEDSGLDGSYERYYNSLGFVQTEVIVDANGKTINFYDPPSTTPSKTMKFEKNPFTFTISDESSGNNEKIEFNPELLQLSFQDTNSTSLEIGLVKVKENNDQAILNEIGLQQYNFEDNSLFFVDPFGITEIGSSSLEIAGFVLDPEDLKMEVQCSLDVIEDLNVTGQKNFRIDHPLDPTNKFLYHSAVESPMPINIYRGNVTTDANGLATVQMPDYFEALNIEHAYQLTVIGTFAQAIVAEEIQDNQFIIQTSEPNVKVSWQVSGQRNDPYFQDHPYKTIREKTGSDKGRLLYDPNRNEPYAESLRNHLDQYEQLKRPRSESDE